jgi:hypothetical protein
VTSRDLPTVGVLRPNHDATILGEDDRPIAFGDIGELVLRSRYIAPREWRGGRFVPAAWFRCRTDQDDSRQQRARTSSGPFGPPGKQW